MEVVHHRSMIRQRDNDYLFRQSSKKLLHIFHDTMLSEDLCGRHVIYAALACGNSRSFEVQKSTSLVLKLKVPAGCKCPLVHR